MCYAFGVKPFTWARAAGLLTAGMIVVLGAACSEGSKARPEYLDYCAAAQASASSCQDPAGCDEALATTCSTLDNVLSPSTLDAARECLEGGCGIQSCLARAQPSARPGDAHRELAERYCSQCAPDVADCQSTFYAKKGGPGGLVLPYADALAAAVSKECTTDKDTCRATFAICATDILVRDLGASFDTKLADCVISSFLRDEEEEGGSPGGTTPAPPGSTPGTMCTPENCTGCCRDGKCEQGFADLACGTSGAACQACSGTQRCAGGSCKESCGPSNCNGCCDGDTCLPGNATDKCGGGGGACTSCATVGAAFQCTNSKCVDPGCQASCASGCCTSTGCQAGTDAKACGSGGTACAACAYGERCGTARSCELDPEATWDVNIGLVTVPSTNKSGASWDANGGAPDPFVKAFSSFNGISHTGQTATFDDTTIAMFEERPLKGITTQELLKGVTIEVWDADLQYDDLIGGCKLPLTAANFDGALLGYVCPATTSTVPVEILYRIARPGY